MVKLNVYKQLLHLYLRRQNNYLKQVKIISFFNYGYIKFKANSNIYVSKKKIFYGKINNFNYFNYCNSVIIYKNQNRGLKKIYKYQKKVFLQKILEAYSLISGSNQLLKKEKYSVGNIKNLCFNTKNLLDLKYRFFFYKIFNQNSFNQYIWRLVKFKRFLNKKNSTNDRNLYLEKRQLVKNNKMSYIEKQHALLTKKIERAQRLKKQKWAANFYNKRKFYYYYCYYRQFDKTNKKINKFTFNKLYFLHDRSKFYNYIRNKEKLVSLFYHLLCKQKILLRCYVKNTYNNFYRYPVKGKKKNLYQLITLLNTQKKFIKFSLSWLLDITKYNVNDKKILKYRSYFPSAVIKKNMKRYKVLKKKFLRKKLIFRVVFKKNKKNLFKFLITPNISYKENFIFNKYKIFKGLPDFQINCRKSNINRIGKHYRYILRYGIKNKWNIRRKQQNKLKKYSYKKKKYSYKKKKYLYVFKKLISNSVNYEIVVDKPYFALHNLLSVKKNKKNIFFYKFKLHYQIRAKWVRIFNAEKARKKKMSSVHWKELPLLKNQYAKIQKEKLLLLKKKIFLKKKLHFNVLLKWSKQKIFLMGKKEINSKNIKLIKFVFYKLINKYKEVLQKRFVQNTELLKNFYIAGKKTNIKKKKLSTQKNYITLRGKGVLKRRKVSTKQQYLLKLAKHRSRYNRRRRIWWKRFLKSNKSFVKWWDNRNNKRGGKFERYQNTRGNKSFGNRWDNRNNKRGGKFERYQNTRGNKSFGNRWDNRKLGQNKYYFYTTIKYSKQVSLQRFILFRKYWWRRHFVDIMNKKQHKQVTLYQVLKQFNKDWKQNNKIFSSEYCIPGVVYGTNKSFKNFRPKNFWSNKKKFFYLFRQFLSSYPSSSSTTSHYYHKIKKFYLKRLYKNKKFYLKWRKRYLNKQIQLFYRKEIKKQFQLLYNSFYNNRKILLKQILLMLNDINFFNKLLFFNKYFNLYLKNKNLISSLNKFSFFSLIQGSLYHTLRNNFFNSAKNNESLILFFYNYIKDKNFSLFTYNNIQNNGVFIKYLITKYLLNSTLYSNFNTKLNNKKFNLQPQVNTKTIIALRPKYTKFVLRKKIRISNKRLLKPWQKYFRRRRRWKRNRRGSTKDRKFVQRNGKTLIKITKRNGRVILRPLRLRDYLGPRSWWRTRGSFPKYKRRKSQKIWRFFKKLDRTYNPFEPRIVKKKHFFSRFKRIRNFLKWKFKTRIKRIQYYQRSIKNHWQYGGLSPYFLATINKPERILLKVYPKTLKTQFSCYTKHFLNYTLYRNTQQSWFSNPLYFAISNLVPTNPWIVPQYTDYTQTNSLFLGGQKHNFWVVNRVSKQYFLKVDMHTSYYPLKTSRLLHYRWSAKYSQYRYVDLTNPLNKERFASRFGHGWRYK